MSWKFRNNKGALLGAAVLVLAFAGMAYASQYHRLGGWGTSTNINEWGICKNVTNNSGNEAFIPTNSSGEWNSLINNGGASLRLSPCLPSLPLNCNLPWGKTVYLSERWKTDPSNSDQIFYVGSSGTDADVSSCVGVWNTVSGSWVAAKGCKYGNERECQAIWISGNTGGAPLYPACPQGYQSTGDGCGGGCSSPHYYDPDGTQYCLGY